MGEVYRAEDTNLSREVAIKVLPEQFTKDPQRLARFEREAKLLAQLNHPNIAAIYGFEKAEGVHFLALELVPGDTLQERVAKGPLPVEEALEVCRQIAEGVEAAHEKGVIHRDLKPANVKVTPEGKVKILDFGLAKAFEDEIPAADISQSPTLTEEMTRAGVILGTAAYMSPEQAKGKEVDKRADIFAFGAVLFELLTGKRAFEGESITETIAAVLKSEPDWEALPQITPWRIQELLRRCLTKDPHDRLDGIANVRVEVRLALSEPTQAFLPTGVPSRSRQIHWAFAAGLAIVIFLAGILLWSLWSVGPMVESLTGRFVINLGLDQHIMSQVPPSTGMATGAFAGSVAMSRDGRHLVYVAHKDNTQETQLYLRDVDQLEARVIPGTENATDPFFSPDNQWVGFASGRELKKVSLSGGLPLSLCTLPGQIVDKMSWSEKDIIVFGAGFGAASGLWQVAASGGEPQPLTRVDSESGEVQHGGAHFLPEGETLLFYVEKTREEIWLLSLETGQKTKLIEGADPWYVSTGHIVFMSNDSLFGVPFDVSRLEVTGSPFPLPEKPRFSTPTSADFAISDTGSLVYVSAMAKNQLVWVDRNGVGQALLQEPRNFSTPKLSPDGKRLAITTWDPRRATWVLDLERNILEKVNIDAESSTLIVSPDGKSIAVGSTADGAMNLYLMPSDGSPQLKRLTPSDNIQIPASWSADSEWIIYVEEATDTRNDIWALPLDNDERPHLVRGTQYDETQPMLSPDGKWLVYRSNAAGQNEVYIEPFPGPGSIKQVSREGGTEPVWAHDGREIFYRNGSQMMVVSVETHPELELGAPALLFEGTYELTERRTPNYDVAPDGKRFLMIEGQPAPTQINVVLNWFEELKRLVPAP